MTLDHYKILNGTLEKRFADGRRTLAEDFDESSANDFFYVYKDAPLSFILSHSRDIFSEPYYGYSFYRNIIVNAIICPTDYVVELEKVTKYIEEAKGKVPQFQLTNYVELASLLEDMVDSYSFVSNIITKVKDSDNGELFLAEVFDALYDVFMCEQRDADDEKVLGHVSICKDYIAEAIFTSPSPYVAVALGFLITRKCPEYTSCLYDLTTRLCHPIKHPDAYGYSRRGINTIQYLMKSGFVVKALSRMPSKALLEKWMRIAAKKPDDICPIPNAMEGIHIPYSPQNIRVEDIPLVAEAIESDDNLVTARYDFLRYSAAKMEADCEMMEDNDFRENAEDLLDEYEAQYLMLEWEDDGKPNAVIAGHIMTSKDRANSENTKRKDANTPINSLVTKNAESDKVAATETELCDKIKKSIEIARKVTPADTESEKQSNEETLSALRSDCKKYKEAIDANNYSTARKLYDELREEILAADNTVTEEFFTLDNPSLSDFLGEEDDGKPKEDTATRLQNKAMDYAAKDTEKAAKNKETRQKLVNAANAVSQKPKRQIRGLKDFVASFDKWDENRRKKFMLKPGFRHKIFKHLRNAIILGAVSQVKLSLIPLLALCSHASKMKDNRIRTELTRELESEIKICDEKINDANAENDRAQKYELMRIRDKLEAEKVRVKINSKYI